jgi:hypothetical protein
VQGRKVSETACGLGNYEIKRLEKLIEFSARNERIEFM